METYGEDIGQNSWLTADEWRTFLFWLELGPASTVLEVACGSGGPALFLAQTTGAHVLGIDINEQGIATANGMAHEKRLDTLAGFEVVDAAKALSSAAASFDGVVCVDSINHLADRRLVLQEWHRVLKPTGRILFTDPIVVTGFLSNEEIAIRSSIGYFLFAPAGADDQLLDESGFTLLRKQDITANSALVSKRWHAARVRHRDELLDIEGADTFEGLQRFLTVVYTLASERRLSRYVYLAKKRGQG